MHPCGSVTRVTKKTQITKIQVVNTRRNQQTSIPIAGTALEQCDFGFFVQPWRARIRKLANGPRQMAGMLPVKIKIVAMPKHLGRKYHNVIPVTDSRSYAPFIIPGNSRSEGAGE